MLTKEDIFSHNDALIHVFQNVYYKTACAKYHALKEHSQLLS